MIKCIKIKEETHTRLLNYISKTQLETNRRITIDEAISNLLDSTA